MMKVGNKVI